MPEKQERQEDVFEKLKFLKHQLKKVFGPAVFMRKTSSKPLINVKKGISYEGEKAQNSQLSLQQIQKEKL